MSSPLYGWSRNNIDVDLNPMMVSEWCCMLSMPGSLAEKWIAVNPIATYYIMGANVYQSPTIYSVIANRLVSHYKQQLVDEMWLTWFMSSWQACSMSIVLSKRLKSGWNLILLKDTAGKHPNHHHRLIRRVSDGSTALRDTDSCQSIRPIWNITCSWKSRIQTLDWSYYWSISLKDSSESLCTRATSCYERKDRDWYLFSCTGKWYTKMIDTALVLIVDTVY